MDKKSMSKPVTRNTKFPANKVNQSQVLDKYKPLPIVSPSFKSKNIQNKKK